MRNSQGRIYARYCQVFQSFLARCLHPARGRGGAVCGLQALADSRGAASGAGAAASAAAAVARRQYVPSAVVAVLRDPGSAARDSAGPGRGTIQSAAGSHAISKYRSGLSALATLAIHRARAMHSQHRWLLAARARTAAGLCRCIGDTGCAVGQDAGIGGLRRLPQSVTATGRYPVARIAADAVVDDGQRPGFRPGAHHPSLVRRLHRCAGWPCADAEQRQSGDHDDWRSDAAWQCATVCRHAGRATGAAVAACALRRSVRTGDDAGDLALSGAAWRIADGVLAAAGRAPSTR